MTILYTRQKSKPSNRKPGWKKVEQEYAEWLTRVSTMKSGIQKSFTAVKLVARKSEVADVAQPLKAKYVIGAGTKPVPRPELQYRDNPEFLARELSARQRRFNVAPAYNKGGDVFVSEDELQAVLSTNRRRP